MTPDLLAALAEFALACVTFGAIAVLLLTVILRHAIAVHDAGRLP